MLQRYDFISGLVNHSFDVVSVGQEGVNCLALKCAAKSYSVLNFNDQNLS